MPPSQYAKLPPKIPHDPNATTNYVAPIFSRHHEQQQPPRQSSPPRVSHRHSPSRDSHRRSPSRDRNSRSQTQQTVSFNVPIRTLSPSKEQESQICQYCGKKLGRHDPISGHKDCKKKR